MLFKFAQNPPRLRQKYSMVPVAAQAHQHNFNV